jgi:hypothetical protein
MGESSNNDKQSGNKAYLAPFIQKSDLYCIQFCGIISPTPYFPLVDKETARDSRNHREGVRECYFWKKELTQRSCP